MFNTSFYYSFSFKKKKEFSSYICINILYNSVEANHVVMTCLISQIMFLFLGMHHERRPVYKSL